MDRLGLSHMLEYRTAMKILLHAEVEKEKQLLEHDYEH